MGWGKQPRGPSQPLPSGEGVLYSPIDIHGLEKGYSCLKVEFQCRTVDVPASPGKGQQADAACRGHCLLQALSTCKHRLHTCKRCLHASAVFIHASAVYMEALSSSKRCLQGALSSRKGAETGSSILKGHCLVSSPMCRLQGNCPCLHMPAQV